MGQCWSCPLLPNNCPGQGNVLPPFLVAGLIVFLEEGRQDKPCVRCMQGRGEGSWLGREDGRVWSPRVAVEEQVCLHSCQGPGFQSTFCFCYCDQLLALPRPQGTQLSRALSPSTCSSLSSRQRWYHWLICFTDGETEALRVRITCPNPEGLIEGNEAVISELEMTWAMSQAHAVQESFSFQ